MAGSELALHCPIFLTAASRRSRVRVSVPVWGATLSRPLAIIWLGEPLPHQLPNSTHAHPYSASTLIVMTRCRALRITWGINPSFPGLSPCIRVGCVRVTHPCATRPCECKSKSDHAAVRLACIKPPASVHPEPGSNSP